ncbi:hypothetical protein EYF80_014769 [Liparis tanakae]|uniref:Uncharacterized protein n=1 Tax=Liparis tanakae TaxID=230148 RepID=A0A4Z2ID54_9TELE|nr:hypothetical protein EYF80_014769 [Liparis tanakae]
MHLVIEQGSQGSSVKPFNHEPQASATGRHHHRCRRRPPPVFSPQLGSASPALIGWTAAHSPHLLVGIGCRSFSFLDGRGQSTLGYRVLRPDLTRFAAPAVDYESQLPLPSPPPLSPSLL